MELGPEEVVHKHSSKWMLLKILQILQEKICTEVSFPLNFFSLLK